MRSPEQIPLVVQTRTDQLTCVLTGDGSIDRQALWRERQRLQQQPANSRVFVSLGLKSYSLCHILCLL